MARPQSIGGIERALQRTKVSARTVWGTCDDIFSQKSPDYLDRTFGNSRGFRGVDGAKLFFPEEFPQLIAEETIKLWSTS